MQSLLLQEWNIAPLMNEELRRALEKRCRRMEIPLMGIADAERWRNPPFQPWMPEDFYPQNIFPAARSVIVIGLPITLPVLESSPSIWYREMYSTVNSLLDQYTYRLSNFLNDRGYPSVFVPRDGYMGIKALLKESGSLLLPPPCRLSGGAGKSSGPTICCLHQSTGRGCASARSSPQPSFPLIRFMNEELCTRCMRCVKMCPAAALDQEDYPQGLTDKKSCAAHSAELDPEGHLSLRHMHQGLPGGRGPKALR